MQPQDAIQKFFTWAKKIFTTWAMSRVVYLNALQALDAALRLGSMKRAAAELGITAAAVGQRIRALEAFTGTLLLERGQAGVTATPATKGVAAALRRAFDDLDQVAIRLNLDRDRPVRIACDDDLLALWLTPRVGTFQAQFPAAKLAFLTEGDPAPPDLWLRCGGAQQVLLPEWLVPVGSPGNLWRLGRTDRDFPLEGMPLLHVNPAPGLATEQGWPEWVSRFGHRQSGADRGFRYRRAAEALNLAAANVGFALLPLALAQGALAKGALVRLFPHLPLIAARNGWTLELARSDRPRPNLVLFTQWLRAAAASYLGALANPVPGRDFAMEIAPSSR